MAQLGTAPFPAAPFDVINPTTVQKLLERINGIMNAALLRAYADWRVLPLYGCGRFRRCARLFLNPVNKVEFSGVPC